MVYPSLEILLHCTVWVILTPQELSPFWLTLQVKGEETRLPGSHIHIASPQKADISGIQMAEPSMPRYKQKMRPREGQGLPNHIAGKI